MAEALLIPAADAVLGSLLPLATNQINLAWGFKEDLEKLRKRLEIIQALLYDAEKKKITSQTMMAWLKKLKTAICDAENVLDELAYEDLREKIEVQNQMRNKHVKDKEEAEKAQIFGKSHIQELQYHWDENLEESDNNHGDVLEGLKPHQNVKGLIIQNFGGRRWVSWMSSDAYSLKKLVKIELRDCMLCEQVPALGHLLHLAILKMSGLNNLKRIGPEFYGQDKWIIDNCCSSGEAAAGVFLTLRELQLVDMPQLEEWSDVSSLLAFATSMIDSFPRLKKLEISNCPKLITIPAFKGSTSLQQLSIVKCDELMCLQGGLLQPTLEEIEIWRCRKLKTLNAIDETEATFNGSTYLQRLSIDDCPELMCLPKELLQPTLVKLLLCDCPKLKTSNPDALRCLTSLKKLLIKSCPNWGSYWEEGLFCTTSLQSLTIGIFGEEGVQIFPVALHKCCITTIEPSHLPGVSIFIWMARDQVPA
ncbi:putative disease resistance RPP13-like protein 1 isoform X2 [Rhododendron vialii]|uniref:putative disease resistance RPP13-like protein 1 isoform X2 n=1 Tax=Rhododendron vialii TaxID=182163 RepID=UPI00265FB33E|nr:putative disease resistance RPP13-like protein 1 isoform X2 [Rhododendron vialii]